MSTPVVMPQMGESIAEGTIVRWIKKVGDSVDRDEPLFEISTDKVDAEIPSPAAGVLTHRREGRRDGSGEQRRRHDRRRRRAGAERRGACGAECRCRVPTGANGAQQSAQADGTPARPSPRRRRRRRRTRHPSHLLAPAAPAHRAPMHPRTCRHRSGDRHKSSPLVRKIAKEHNVDIGRIQGSGHRRPRHQAGHPRLHRRRSGVRSRATGRGAATPAAGAVPVLAAPATRSSRCR